jgi:hypothetical protein
MEYIDAVGYLDFRSAAEPEAMGAENEVPSGDAQVPFRDVVNVATPGAATSTDLGPQLENDATEPVCLEAPTTSIIGTLYEAGYEGVTSMLRGSLYGFAFPADTTINMPALLALKIASYIAALLVGVLSDMLMIWAFCAMA